MKKICISLLCIVLIFLCVSVPVFALEEGTEAAADETLFTRVFEYLKENKDTVISAAGNVLMFAAAITTYVRGKKRNGMILGKVTTIATGTQTIGGQQTSVIDAVNRLIEGYNTMESKIKEYGVFDRERDRFMVVMTAQNAAILEILQTVYANSKNLPQGIKDLISIKYANCLKLTGDNKALLEIFDKTQTVPESEEGVEDEA